MDIIENVLDFCKKYVSVVEGYVYQGYLYRSEICYIFLLAVAILILAFIMIRILLSGTRRNPDLSRNESEKYYSDPNGKEKFGKFPSINDPATLQLSVIVPSYNEEERLPIMLKESIQYLEKRIYEVPSFTYEIIIVDDGSKDKTSEIGIGFTKKYGSSKVRVLTLEKNRGKGGAVRMGMMSARGKYLLMVDADGATKFSDLEKVENGLRDVHRNSNEKALSCGSRSHLENEAIASRSLFRTFLMKGFHMLVWLLCVRTIRDTQCGFKLFTRPAAQELFINLHVERWAFDVELLYIAEKLKMPIAEVAVTWNEIDGSKMVPVFSWIQMGKDLVLIYLQYVTGRWTVKKID